MKEKKLKIRLLTILIAASITYGCAPNSMNNLRTEADVNVPRLSKGEKIYFNEKQHDGSIWKTNAQLNGMFMDEKARCVGDIITIKIVESTSASNKASTRTNRQSAISGGLENFLNLESKFPISKPGLNPFGGVKGDLFTEFDGSGTTTRSGNLNAYLTGRVVEILPNGNLKIIGVREVWVNNEKQMIMLSGMVRQRDISPNNIILSTYIADAKISYTGAGIVNEGLTEGWLTRLIKGISPF